jgi:hypothetical protein
MPKKTEPVRARLLVAKEAFTCRFQGADHSFNPGDIVEEGHPILRGIEHLFKPVEAITHYRVHTPEDAPVEQATAAPGEERKG